jgi:tetratricopeptide (TPR) repeat protein
MTSPRLPRALQCFAAAALLAAALPVAHAQKKGSDPAMDRARKHYAVAQQLFSVGRFAEALPRYEAAFKAKPLPEFLFNIGQCHRNLRHYDKAIFSFRRYLTLKPHAANRAKVEKLINELEDKQRKKEEAERRTAAMLRTKKRPQHPPARSRPFYKKWWFWTGVGAVAATTGAVLVLGGGGGSVPASDLGNVDFGK